MKRYLYLGLILILVLLIYGIFRFPTALSDFSGLAGDIVILLVFGLLIRFWFSALEQKAPSVIQAAWRSGLVVGIIFAGEMILEYILLPTDNSKMGLIEYSLVSLIFFAVSLWILIKQVVLEMESLQQLSVLWLVQYSGSLLRLRFFISFTVRPNRRKSSAQKEISTISLKAA